MKLVTIASATNSAYMAMRLVDQRPESATPVECALSGRVIGFVCGLISCGIGGIARRGYTHVELRFFHPDCNRWPRILTGSAAFAGRGLRYGAVMNAGRAVTASKDFHLP